MYAVLLTIHVMIALAMTLSAVAVVVKAYSHQRTGMYGTMLGTFGLTVVSGLGLLLVSPAGLGRFCVMMSVFTLGVLLVRAYYRARLTAI